MASRLVILLLTALLVASLLLNYILYKQGRQFYLQLNATKLAPVGLSVFPAIPLDPPGGKDKAKRIIFFGDSRIAQWPQPELTGYEMLNWGIGGETSSQILHRYDAHVVPLAPNILLIQAGVNDLKTIPLFP
ncbi:MAG: hypothetical protein D3910_15985 [Candidatus Electrothrix sp. ATG2]|nr:hypothetical protein [Candidatus Electrothrix sp. ATG2]